MKKVKISTSFFFIIISCNFIMGSGRIITENGFEGCIELTNEEVRVVLEPNIGGRVLKYELNSNNILYVDSSQNGIKEKPEDAFIGPCAGRFDIGPNRIIPKREILWWGKWTAEITGDYSAKLTSQFDSATGVQLIREFKLSENSSKLVCRQVILNKSKETKRYCFWSRTFVDGGGMLFVPLNSNSRYPEKYLSYGHEKQIFFNPEKEDGLQISNNLFVLRGTPKYKKYSMDGTEGWIAYLSKDNMLFVKKYKVYTDKIYGDMTGCTATVWFKKDKICEIEPWGPWEVIKPGEQTSFSEEWYLYNFKKLQEDGNTRDSIINVIKPFILNK